MSKLLTCSNCKKTLHPSFFWADKSASSGRCSRCKSCASTQKRLYESRSKESRIRLDGKTSLNELLTLSQRKGSFISGMEAKAIFKAYILSKKQGKEFADILKEYQVKRTLGGCNNFIIELRKAAKANMTLEEYLKQGRPFKFNFHKKVLVRASK